MWDDQLGGESMMDGEIFAERLARVLTSRPELIDVADREQQLMRWGLDRRYLAQLPFEAPLKLFAGILAFQLERLSHDEEDLEAISGFLSRLVELQRPGLDTSAGELVAILEARAARMRSAARNVRASFPESLSRYRERLDSLVGVLHTGFLGDSFPSQTRIEKVHVSLPLNAQLVATVGRLGIDSYEILGVRGSGREEDSMGQRPELRSPRLVQAVAHFESIARGEVIGSLMGEGSRSLALAPILTPGHRHVLDDLSIEDGLQQFRRLLITGGPGAGKSTAARALVADLVRVPEERTGTSALDVIPVFISVRALTRWSEFARLARRSDADLVAEYASATLASDDPDAMAGLREVDRDGRMLLVLDGLDEVWVGEDDAEQGIDRGVLLQRCLERFLASHASASVLITARPEAEASYWSTLVAHGFRSTQLAPLTADYASAVANRFLELSGSASREADGERFREIWGAGSSDVLAAPLYVALFAASIGSSPGEVVRPTRSALIGQALRLLALRWSTTRSQDDLDEGTPIVSTEASQDLLLRALRRIALRNVTEGEETRHGVDVGDVFRELQVFRKDMYSAFNYLVTESGVLQEIAIDRFDFRLRQFEEYLAAAEIAEKGDLAEFADAIGRRPARWLEPLGIAAELIAARLSPVASAAALADVLLEVPGEDGGLTWPYLWSAGVVIERLLDECALPVTAGTCRRLTEGIRGGFPLLDLRIPARGREQVGHLVARIGDNRTGVGVDAGGIPEHYWIPIPLAEVTIGTDEAEEEKLRGETWATGWNVSFEQPSHTVRIAPFEVSKYPVTVVQFQAFCDSEDGYRDARWWDGLADGGGGQTPAIQYLHETDGSHPVSSVTWFEAVAYARWLSERTGSFVRLPSEVEWEYAARGSTGRRFAWGDEYRAMTCNGLDSGLDGPCTVGIHESGDGPWGVDSPVDVCGNVWEWCSTIHSEEDGVIYPYPYDATDGREDPTLGDRFRRVVRGGSFTNVPFFLRLAMRGYDRPNFRTARQGFRVVRERPYEG